MITKLRLLLDYRCYPVWLYDEKDQIVDTLLPEELRGDTELDAKFDSLQARYDALFIDNSHEFSYIGFNSEADKQKFIADWEEAVKELKQKTNGRYIIVDDIAKAL